MEIFRNTTQSVTLPLPAGINADTSEIEVLALENGVQIYDFPTVARTAEGYAVQLPWSLVRLDRDFEVRFSFAYTEGGVTHQIQESVCVEVVTPILPLTEIATVANADLATPMGESDTLDLERRVRHAIQAYTQQRFGKYRATFNVRATGGQSLALPAPLISLDGGGYVSNGDGWSLSLGGWAYPEYAIPPYDILRPTAYKFTEGRNYKITGTWGYSDVPADVKQAARMLAADYSCDESLWRERYIDSVRAGNWRFEVNSATFNGTGNVVADQILLPYRRLNMVMI